MNLFEKYINNIEEETPFWVQEGYQEEVEQLPPPDPDVPDWLVDPYKYTTYRTYDYEEANYIQDEETDYLPLLTVVVFIISVFFIVFCLLKIYLLIT